MNFSFYKEFSEFHIFKAFKSLFYDWWSLDILLIEKNSNNFFYNPQTPIQNKITSVLLDSSIFKEDLIQSLSSLPKEELVAGQIYIINWKQVDSEIFAVPVIIKGSLEGFVLAVGFMPQNRNRLSAVLDYLNKEKSWQEKEIAKLKVPSQKDLQYLKDLLCILVEESSSLHMQKINQNQLLEKLDRATTHSPELIGKSVAMQFLYNILDKIKTSEKSFLVQGEPGTGKKFLSKIIHESSRRGHEFFQILDCSSLRESDLKVELFGKATEPPKLGLLEKATSGTLVLDKIESLSLNLQARILEFLEDKTFLQVGASQQKKKTSNTRILALSSSPLKKSMKEGTFKEDLFYKLNVINFKVPSLRDRTQDIPLLIHDFIENKFPEKNKKFSPRAMKHLLNYSWPQNVRELQSEIEKVIVLSEDNETLITENYLSPHICENSPVSISDSSLKQMLSDFEKKIILDCLKKEGWNKSAVAKKLKLSRTALIYKTKCFNIPDKKLKE